MQASDIMTAHVVTVTPDTTVQELAKVLTTNGISAVPIVGVNGGLVGIVSEGDLLRRRELNTARTRSWWLELFASEHTLAQEFIKVNAVKVADIMTRDVVTVTPETPLAEVARLLEEHQIKRVPVVSNRQVVGIVSRANLVQVLASLEARPHLQSSSSDTEIRDRILRRLESEPWAHTLLLNVLVNDGIVELWGVVQTPVEKRAIRVAAEATEGARVVNDHIVVRRIISHEGT